MAVCLADACLDRFVGFLGALLDETALHGIEVEVLAFLPDRFPRHPIAHGLFKFEQAFPIGREEGEHVLVLARAVATSIKNLLRGHLGRTAAIRLGIRSLRGEHHQATGLIIFDVAAIGRRDVHADEV